ncbi:MAG: hypothetical protein CVV62_01155 [Tenericutes bacterium HGW-Tenericutes-7]|nr:MAG: hypothetical protein CVV62_01155 [Tenericutes bacterium HGW-Tenericutes-7]
MRDIVKAFDDLPWIVKVIFALPGLDFLWGVYRLIKGMDNKNNVTILAGIIWIFAGWAILWIIDLFTLFTSKNITAFAD